MHIERQFFDAIRERPDDDAPRLIYADWLDGLGDPRGEFIRVQCELARIPASERARKTALEQREKSLLKEFQRDWLQTLKGLNFQFQDVTFQRGFLAEGKLIYRSQPWDAPSEFTEHWRELLQVEPGLRRVGLSLYRDWCEVKRMDYAPQLRALHFNCLALSRREVSTLLRWPVVQGLVSLDLSHNNLRAGAECVAYAPSLDHLQELDLGWNQIGNRGARALASSSYLQSLKRLNLRGNCIGPHGRELLRIAFGPRVQL
jgi:uncharacterized protein (TIGR02996 family)